MSRQDKRVATFVAILAVLAALLFMVMSEHARHRPAGLRLERERVR